MAIIETLVHHSEYRRGGTYTHTRSFYEFRKSKSSIQQSQSTTMKVLYSTVGKWTFDNTEHRVIADRIKLRKDFGKAVAQYINSKAWDNLFALFSGENILPCFRYSDDLSLVDVLPTKLRDALAEALEQYGTWKQTHWHHDTFFQKSPHSFFHCLHTSTVDATQVAYYESLEKMLLKRETRTKPGRYLTKYFGGVLSAEQINTMASIHVAMGTPVKIKWANTEAEIIHAINHGPSESCMTKKYHDEKAVWYKGHIHPAAVYATGDFTVAYITDPRDESHITARCICNKATKKAARIYGDQDKLRLALDAEGYEQRRLALSGLRLRKIPDEKNHGRHIMSYVDKGTESGGGSLNIVDAGEYWMTTSDAGFDTYEAYNHKGTINYIYEDEPVVVVDDDEPEYEYSCDSCNEGCHELTRVFGGDNLCECCSESYSSANVHVNGRNRMALVHDDYIVEVDGDYYHQDHIEHFNIVQCAETGDYASIDDMSEIYGGYVLTSRAVQLTVPYDGYEITNPSSAITLDDGRVVHVDQVTRCGLTQARILTTERWFVSAQENSGSGTLRFHPSALQDPAYRGRFRVIGSAVSGWQLVFLSNNFTIGYSLDDLPSSFRKDIRNNIFTNLVRGDESLGVEVALTQKEMEIA